MRPAGEAAFERRREDRTSIYSFDGSWAMDPAAEEALRARDGAWDFWVVQPDGYRRLATAWVMSAKRPETRQRRLGALVEASAAGERLPEISGGRRPPDRR
jgi:hypothetical protein